MKVRQKLSDKEIRIEAAEEKGNPSSPKREILGEIRVNQMENNTGNHNSNSVDALDSQSSEKKDKFSNDQQPSEHSGLFFMNRVNIDQEATHDSESIIKVLLSIVDQIK
jgi:hypothetical protein